MRLLGKAREAPQYDFQFVEERNHGKIQLDKVHVVAAFHVTNKQRSLEENCRKQSIAVTFSVIPMILLGT